MNEFLDIIFHQKNARISYVLLKCMTGLLWYIFNIKYEKWMTILLIYGLTIFLYSLIKKNVKFEKVNIIILLLFGTIYISCLASNGWEFISTFNSLIEEVVLFFVVFTNYSRENSISKKEFKCILKILIIVFTFMSLTTFYYYLTESREFYINLKGNMIPLYAADRLSGTYFHPNRLGIMTYVAIFSIIPFINTKKISTINNFILILLIVLHFFLLVLSDCRSAYVSFGIFLFLIAYLNRKKIYTYVSKYFKIFLSGFTLLICIFSWLILKSERIQQLISFASNLIKNEGFNNKVVFEILNLFSSNRLRLWIDAVMIAKNNFLIGVGNGNLRVSAIKLLGNDCHINKVQAENVHNIFLNILCFSGIIALILFIYLLMLIIKSIVKQLKFKTNWNSLELSVIAIFIGTLVYGILDIAILYHFDIVTVMFWITASYILTMQIDINLNFYLKNNKDSKYD